MVDPNDNFEPRLAVERKSLYAEYRANAPTIGDKGRQGHLAKVLSQLLDGVPRNWPILDLGCGDGLLLAVATQMGFSNALGCDVVPEQVFQAQARGLSVECIDLFRGLEKHSNETIGVIVTFDVLEHLTRLEQLKLREEVWRVLHPGGLWLIHVPNALSPFFGAVRHGDLTHECAFTPASMVQLLSPAGFSVRCVDDGPTPRGWKSAARWLAWRVIRVGLTVLHAVETGAMRYPALTRNMLVIARKH